MGSTSPEPGPGAQDEHGSAFAQASFGAGPRPAGRRSTVRVICGILWAVIAVVCGAGGVGEAVIGNVGGAVVSLVIAVLAGWYDVRVWTFRARLLVLIIGIISERPG